MGIAQKAIAAVARDIPIPYSDVLATVYRTAYAIAGSGCFSAGLDAEACISDGAVALFGDGDTVAVTTAEQPVRFLLVSGKPLGEPISWGGPIVMNTREELEEAFEELEEGTFIRHD